MTAGIDLTGRAVLVTGAAGNLGRAVVEGLATAGASLALLDRAADRLATVAADPNALRLPGLDLTDEAAVGNAVQATVARFGRLDGVVCTVGGFHASGGLLDDGWAVWQAMADANLRSTFTVCRAAIAHLTAPGGRIVTVGARPALAAPAGFAAYAAAKAGVLRLTESLAAELKPRGITANAIVPSIIDTPANRRAMPKADVAAWTKPAAIADVVLFLVSDLSRAVTGAALPV